MYLSNFRSERPPHLIDQTDGLRWLARAKAREHPQESVDYYYRRLTRFGCGPGVVASRGTFLRDFTHDDHAAMLIFGANPRGDLESRQSFFHEVIRAPTERLTPVEPGFAHWIHVTCTGYVSPSVVQEIVSQREWGTRVETLHAYHMGCYSAIPALRMARGLGATEITHTELCTLHLEPSSLEPEQMVIQSLFADGLIAYRATPSRPADVGFHVEATREVIVPASRDAMTWAPAARGFRMTLSREVPALIRAHVARVVEPWSAPGTMFAIHPGGPRIIDAVKEALSLSEEQVYFSRKILRERGNMSSATMPHVWLAMLTGVPPGTPVISLAFGPGLTVAAALMRTVA